MAKFVIDMTSVNEDSTDAIIKASRLEGEALTRFAEERGWLSFDGPKKRINWEACAKHVAQAVQVVLGRIPQEKREAANEVAKKEKAMEAKTEAYELLDQQVEGMDLNYQDKKRLRAEMILAMGKEWWVKKNGYPYGVSGLKSRLRATAKKALKKLEADKETVRQEMEARRKAAEAKAAKAAEEEEKVMKKEEETVEKKEGLTLEDRVEVAQVAALAVHFVEPGATIIEAVEWLHVREACIKANVSDETLAAAAAIDAEVFAKAMDVADALGNFLIWLCQPTAEVEETTAEGAIGATAQVVETDDEVEEEGDAEEEALRAMEKEFFTWVASLQRLFETWISEIPQKFEEMFPNGVETHWAACPVVKPPKKDVEATAKYIEDATKWWKEMEATMEQDLARKEVNDLLAVCVEKGWISPKAAAKRRGEFQGMSLEELMKAKTKALAFIEENEKVKEAKAKKEPTAVEKTMELIDSIPTERRGEFEERVVDSVRGKKAKTFARAAFKKGEVPKGLTIEKVQAIIAAMQQNNPAEVANQPNEGANNQAGETANEETETVKKQDNQKGAEAPKQEEKAVKKQKQEKVGVIERVKLIGDGYVALEEGLRPMGKEVKKAKRQSLVAIVEAIEEAPKGALVGKDAPKGVMEVVNGILGGAVNTKAAKDSRPEGVTWQEHVRKGVAAGLTDEAGLTGAGMALVSLFAAHLRKEVEGDVVARKELDKAPLAGFPSKKRKELIVKAEALLKKGDKGVAKAALALAKAKKLAEVMARNNRSPLAQSQKAAEVMEAAAILQAIALDPMVEHRKILVKALLSAKVEVEGQGEAHLPGCSNGDAEVFASAVVAGVAKALNKASETQLRFLNRIVTSSKLKSMVKAEEGSRIGYGVLKGLRLCAVGIYNVGSWVALPFKAIWLATGGALVAAVRADKGLAGAKALEALKGAWEALKAFGWYRPKALVMSIGGALKSAWNWVAGKVTRKEKASEEVKESTVENTESEKKETGFFAGLKSGVATGFGWSRKQVAKGIETVKAHKAEAVTGVLGGIAAGVATGLAGAGALAITGAAVGGVIVGGLAAFGVKKLVSWFRGRKAVEVAVDTTAATEGEPASVGGIGADVVATEVGATFAAGGDVAFAQG